MKFNHIFFDQMIDTGFLGILGVLDVVVFVPDKQEVVALPIQQPEEQNRIFIRLFPEFFDLASQI